MSGGIRPKTSSGSAYLKLRRIYDERIGDRMSQAEFARRFGLGAQCTVALYLSGSKPLGVEAAAKFAKGLGCTVADFAPELAERFNEEVVPFLGKRLRRAAMIALSIPAVSSLAPRDAQAGPTFWATAYYVKSPISALRRLCAYAQALRDKTERALAHCIGAHQLWLAWGRGS